ncbi:metal-dependent hydrolase [Leptospira hartskeerlii]|uniref:Metal-dependent hydrolase n=1 Tax=Leptospira hartskeerlii TaxID=2023177 RepID=A0A2M9XH62_9LEPT|nr:metal-dependent hydrolase [Leptospira hartskeerlii]PJZ26912.1 metal-dependent hydrolase [Leptospira hartskeerlii]PJZ34606.1 metal-dependent hydrolase [Leptospira hartskeerlii]
MSTQTKNKNLKSIDANSPTVRKMNFEGLENLPDHYIANNSFMTHTVNAYHILFPEGERFFIKSVKAFADQVKDPGLSSRVKSFIGQEVQHGKEHEKILEILKGQGRPITLMEKFYKWTAFSFFLPIFEFFFGKKLKLAVTAGLEHYTASMAEISIRNNFHDDAYGDMRSLLLWHACEEIEHKSVAYDVLQTVSKSHFLRIMGFIVASFMFWGYALSLQHWFLLTDKKVGFRKYFEDMKSARRIGRILYPQLFSAALLYFKKDFHPDQTGGYELANAALITI